MMATTHALAGAAIAAGVAVLAPEAAPVALVAGLAGGVFPDLDLYGYHRRTLHFPTYYTLAAVAATFVAIAVGTTLWIGVATFLVAAAFHARLDRYGGGLELRPWEGTSDRAVYDHWRQRWRRPLRWVHYDGSPGDLVVATGFAVPALVVFPGEVRWVFAAMLGVSIAYVLVRKRLPALAKLLAGTMPRPVRRHVPARYLP